MRGYATKNSVLRYLASSQGMTLREMRGKRSRLRKGLRATVVSRWNVYVDKLKRRA